MAYPEIQINDVVYRNGKTPILLGISANFTEKRIAIIGRNGSGKSTLVRVLSGLVCPNSGSVLIDGIDPYRDRKSAIQLVGILFQNPDHQIIFPTVVEEIGFGLRQMGLPPDQERAKVVQILDQFGKLDWLERQIVTLSQGQKQLVCLMSVLVMQPKVLILDEPFSGLDIPTTKALERIIDSLDQIVVHISHDPAIIARYDRVLWIEDGQLFADGRPDDVLPKFLTAMDDAVGGSL